MHGKYCNTVMCAQVPTAVEHTPPLQAGLHSRQHTNKATQNRYTSTARAVAHNNILRKPILSYIHPTVFILVGHTCNAQLPRADCGCSCYTQSSCTSIYLIITCNTIKHPIFCFCLLLVRVLCVLQSSNWQVTTGRVGKMYAHRHQYTQVSIHTATGAT